MFSVFGLTCIKVALCNEWVNNKLIGFYWLTKQVFVYPLIRLFIIQDGTNKNMVGCDFYESKLPLECDKN